MADTKISALPAASTPLTGSEVVPLNQSGVTSNVTVANLTAGRNITFNNTLPGYTTTATAAGTTTLTSSSTYHQRFTGSSAQTIVLPAATTMAQGQGFIIDNDSSGTLALQDGSTASLGSVTPGMAVYVFCENNSTTAGSWSGYMFVPGGGPSGQVTWGTSGLSMGGQTITNATSIKFGSGTVLSDYEEGTWTPVISANGSGSVTFTATTQSGRYTKIGRQVSIICEYVYTDRGTVGGSYAFMTGLPFTSGGKSFMDIAIQQSATDLSLYTAYLPSSSTTIQFWKNNYPGAAGAMLGTDFPLAGSVVFCMTYFV